MCHLCTYSKLNKRMNGYSFIASINMTLLCISCRICPTIFVNKHLSRLIYGKENGNPIVTRNRRIDSYWALTCFRKRVRQSSPYSRKITKYCRLHEGSGQCYSSTPRATPPPPPSGSLGPDLSTCVTFKRIIRTQYDTIINYHNIAFFCIKANPDRATLSPVSEAVAGHWHELRRVVWEPL